MKFQILIIAALTASASCPAAERRVISTAPNGQVAIVEAQADSGDRDYYFVRRLDNKQLGFVLPSEQRNEISNVAIVASWSPRNTRVALLVFYGTKLSELLVFRRADDGRFVPVNLLVPDPITLYRKHAGKTLPQPGDGYSENGVGPWLDEDTVLLLSGEAKQTEDLDEYFHLLVTFRTHVIGKRAGTSHLKLIGPLTNIQSEKFLKKWGNKYVEAHN